MKKLNILLMLSVTYLSGAAQKLKDTEVPKLVKQSFATTYPGQKASWEKEKENYEAGFKKDGKTMSATFQADGKFLESESSIQAPAMPPTAMSYIQSHYSGKKISEYAKITGADGSVRYEAEIGGKDVLFDSKGGFLKEVVD